MIALRNVMIDNLSEKNLFDPIAEIGNIIRNSGLSIEEVAEMCGLKAQPLKKSLSRAPHFKLGAEDALKICVVLGDVAFVRAWAKSLGRDVFKLPPQSSVSDNPVVHVRASNLALASFIMVASASADESDSDAFAWLANMLSAFADCVKSAMSLSAKTSVSLNELTRQGVLWADFLGLVSECPLPHKCIPPLSQVVSDLGAANKALNGRRRLIPASKMP